MAESTRFADALSAEKQVDVANVPVEMTENLVALPTVGMILPNWFLLIPKKHSLNFGMQSENIWSDAKELSSKLQARIAAEDFIVFEHGAAMAGSLVGCGVDHAHLHVLFGTRQLISKVWEAIVGDLSEVPFDCSWEHVRDCTSKSDPYYFAWHKERAVAKVTVKELTSQRLRRVIAGVAGVPDKWNYKEYEFRSNIDITLVNLAGSCALAA